MPEELFQILDDDRYDRYRLISWWEQDKLRAGKVLVVGAGALGNEVLKNLALLGVGNIYVIDFDTIENSNLTRSVLYREADSGRPKAEVAAERIRDLNPDIRVTAHHGNAMTELGLGLFADADVVIGCLDNREARLWVNRCCWKVGTPWIDGGIQEISGVCKVFVPPDSACYECAMTENDYKLINLRYSCPLLRREDLLEGKVPTAPTISSIIAGMQTQEALKLLHGMPVAAGKAMIFNGVSNTLYTTAYQHKPDCLSHETYPEPTRLPLSAGMMAETFFRAVEKTGLFRESDAGMSLELDRDLVVSLDCPNCKTSRDIYKPRTAVGMKQADCPTCKAQCRPKIIHSVEDGSVHIDRSLSDLGIPPYDIVRVVAGDVVGYFLLGEDAESVWSN